MKITKRDAYNRTNGQGERYERRGKTEKLWVEGDMGNAVHGEELVCKFPDSPLVKSAPVGCQEMDANHGWRVTPR